MITSLFFIDVDVMKPLFKPCLISLLVASYTSSLAAQETSQDKAAQQQKDVERITVTAHRKESLDTDLAMSVHGVGEEQLQLDNGQHAAESLNSISGVLIDQLSGGQGHKSAIRMPMNTSGYYLFLQDNIPLQSPAFFNHNALWWSSFNSNVARMEVLKGAGTALYGSGAVAATVNVLSQPVSDKAETKVGLMLADDNYQKLQASHSKKISDTQGFRVSSSYFSNDGWRDHTASKRAEVNFRHELELSADERLVTSLVVSDLEQEMATSLTAKQYKLDRTDSGLTDDVLEKDPLRKTQYLRLASQWDKATADSYYSLIPYYRLRTNDYTATWQINMPKVESEVQTLGLLALANFTHNNGSEMTLGFDVELTEGEQFSDQPTNCDTERCASESEPYVEGKVFYDDTTKYTGLSPYLQYSHELTDNLALTLGARYDYAKYEYDNHLGVFGDIGHNRRSLPDRDDSFSHLSPKASLNYRLTDETSVYLRYANSFRLPTASSLYHLTMKDSGEFKAVDPEVSDTYELGYKGNFDSFTFDAAIYYMDVDDAIVRAYINEGKNKGQRILINADRVTHKGIELALNWQISEQFSLNTAYSQSKHQYDQHEKFSGNEMKMAPDYIANIRLSYAPDFLAGLTSMLEVQSIGEYWMDDANSVDEQGNNRIYQGYTIANLKARYQVSTQLSVHARLLNATDKNYVQEAEYRYGNARYAPGAPRTFYLGINYQW